MYLVQDLSCLMGGQNAEYSMLVSATSLFQLHEEQEVHAVEELLGTDKLNYAAFHTPALGLGVCVCVCVNECVSPW